MDMLLMGLCVSIFGIAVSALAFAAATRQESKAPELQPQLPAVKDTAPGRFFSDRPAPKIAPQVHVPIEVLLQQIESHIRLEQAAAESFVEFPTQALLHSKTGSPFMN